MEHDRQLVLGQVQLSRKSNEIPAFHELLDQLKTEVKGVVFTADALHTQRRHARVLHGLGADFVFQVKGNQPRLFAALDALDWGAVPVGHEETVRGHGRSVRRTMQVLPAPDDLPFPHVSQVFLCERYVSDPDGKLVSAVAILGVTSASAERATSPPNSHACARASGSWRCCTSCGTRSTRRTPPACAPLQAHASWPPCATSPSAHTASPDTPPSPKPPAGPAAPCTARSTSSDSHTDLETAVEAPPRIPCSSTGCHNGCDAPHRR